MTRPNRIRLVDGEQVDTEAYPLRRVLAPPESSTGLMKDYVIATPALSVTEISVGKAFYILFGRAPDNSGLAYWNSYFGVGQSVATVADGIIVSTAGAFLIDLDNRAFVGMVYNYLFGKCPEEDQAGQDFWTNQLNNGVSKGTMIQNILEAVVGISGYHADQLRNRLLVVESICRLQKSENYNLSVQDSRTSVLRVTGTPLSYEEAMGDIYRLLVSKIASTPLTWAVSLTSSELYSRARVPDNTTVRQHRYLVWYNRNGEMMLAQAYLPPNFTSVASHRGIISIHGGGWRQGYPEKLYSYNTAFAEGTDPSYVVLGMQYRLTAYNYTSPGPEQDAQDFWDLVNNSPFLKLTSGKVGMFGESSGGHLACFVGSSVDVPRVFAMYPPVDLRGDPAVSVGLDPYVDYYATTTTTKASASTNLKWTSARTTEFQIWHGLSDDFVPVAQSQAFKTVVGTKCKLVTRQGEGHGFSTPTRAEVITEAIKFFDDRQPLT